LIAKLGAFQDGAGPLEVTLAVICVKRQRGHQSGRVISSGTELTQSFPGGVTIRYVVANDSNKPTGKFTVVGSLHKNGQKLPHPVPPTTIQLQPKELWKHEHAVSHQDSFATYVARLLADVGDFVNEEDEKNNKAEAEFKFSVVPK
jgi:hypothetical protein